MVLCEADRKTPASVGAISRSVFIGTCVHFQTSNKDK